jgi:hypothetical protein
VPDLPKPLQDILAQFGLSQESTHTFKFGGVVGKIAIVTLGGFLATVGVAKYTSGPTQIICVIAILLTTILTVRWILEYAEKHPTLATLEGAEIILWQQQQIMLAAKNMPAPPESPIIPNPGGAPPQLNPPHGADE